MGALKLYFITPAWIVILLWCVYACCAAGETTTLEVRKLTVQECQRSRISAPTQYQSNTSFDFGYFVIASTNPSVAAGERFFFLVKEVNLRNGDARPCGQASIDEGSRILTEALTDSIPTILNKSAASFIEHLHKEASTLARTIVYRGTNVLSSTIHVPVIERHGSRYLLGWAVGTGADTHDVRLRIEFKDCERPLPQCLGVGSVAVATMSLTGRSCCDRLHQDVAQVSFSSNSPVGRPGSTSLYDPEMWFWNSGAKSKELQVNQHVYTPA